MRLKSASTFIPSFDELDFEETLSAPASAEAQAAIELPPFLPRAEREPPVDDTTDLVANARLAAAAEARAAADRQIERLRAEHEAALEAARRQWAEEQAAALSERFAQAVEEIGERIADSVGRVLLPFLGTELRDAASRALIAQIVPLFSGADGALIQVSAPADLAAALRQVFPAGQAVEFVESDGGEVRIVAGETVIETRIAAWADKLEGRGPDRRQRRSAR